MISQGDAAGATFAGTLGAQQAPGCRPHAIEADVLTEIRSPGEAKSHSKALFEEKLHQCYVCIV